MAGSFSYTPAVGKVLHAGKGQTLSATFTPTDRTDYVSGGSVQTSINVKQVPLKITANAISANYGGTLPAFTFSTAGFVNGDTASSLTKQPTCTTTATSTNGKVSSPAGSYPIDCSGAGDANYSPITYKAGTLTVTLSPVVQTYTGPTLLTANTDPRLSMKLTSPSGAAIAGRKVTLTLGIHPRIVQSCTATTKASGAAGCTIKDIPYYKGKRIITMTFAGDPRGVNYDYAAGQTMVKVLMKSQGK